MQAQSSGTFLFLFSFSVFYIFFLFPVLVQYLPFFLSTSLPNFWTKPNQQTHTHKKTHKKNKKGAFAPFLYLLPFLHPLFPRLYSFFFRSSFFFHLSLFSTISWFSCFRLAVLPLMWLPSLSFLLDMAQKPLGPLDTKDPHCQTDAMAPTDDHPCIFWHDLIRWFLVL